MGADFFEFDRDFFLDNNIVVKNFSLFAEMPNTLFFIKDINTRMVMANKPVLQSWGHYDKKPIIGLTNDEFVHGKLAEKYNLDDNFVMQGNNIIDRIEIVAGFDGNTLILASTRKYPLYNSANKITGLVGLGKPCEQCDIFADSPVLEYMKNNIDKQIKIEELAKIAKKSISSFERSFRQKYHTAPITYFNYVKINRICMLLRNTDKTIAEIAHSLGFCDQSYMCKSFKKVMGISPKEYRQK